MTTQFLQMLAIAWQPLCISLMALSGLIGLIAVLSPKHFRFIATFSGRWVSTDRFLRWIDTRVDIDHWFLGHSRLFGAVLLVAIGVVAYFAVRLP